MRIVFFIILIFGLTRAEYIRDNTNDIVIDTATNLVWQDSSSGSAKNWSDAIDYCENLTLASYSDWRLPNILELTSLIDFTANTPAINSKFQNTNSNHYWSSTTASGDTTRAIDVNFINANHYKELKTSTVYVRCVRAGQ